MKVWHFITCALLLSPLCYAKSDVDITNEAKEAVRKNLTSKYEPGNCERWKVLESSGQAKQGSAVANCDSNFNPLLGLGFSELKVIRHENYNTVCGIVSGHTDISRIGGRFVYNDSKGGSFFIKYSKYPLLLISKNTDLQKIISKQLELESVNCK